MKVPLKDSLVVLISETDGEAGELARWKTAHGDHVLVARTNAAPNAAALELHDLGPRAEACREPINVVSSSPDPAVRLISNLAATPFELDGRRYRSVESFWQGLKFPDEAERARIADCEGPPALSEGSRQGYGKVIVFEGVEILVGAGV